MFVKENTSATKLRVTLFTKLPKNGIIFYFHNKRNTHLFHLLLFKKKSGVPKLDFPNI